MVSWFVPPIVIPISLIAIILAVAIYHAYANARPRLQAVAVGSPTDTLTPGKLARGGRA